MRSADYTNREMTFARLEPQHLVRIALVNGLHPRYSEGERGRYTRLMETYSDVQRDQLRTAFRVLRDGPRSPRERRFLQGILGELKLQLHYDKGLWKPFDYDHLKKEGVVVPYEESNRGLVQKILTIPESKVISLRDPPWNGADRKHLGDKRKLVLNGPEVIKKFAEQMGFPLPEDYQESGNIDGEMEALLKAYGFTFSEAFRTAFRLLREPEYQDRRISALAIERPSGGEMRFYLNDIIEAVELCQYLERYGPKIEEKLGDLLERSGDKYHGLNSFRVPKRIPDDETHNQVEARYLPHFGQPKRRPLDWMYLDVRCNCGNSMNRRNFEQRRGERGYVVENFDTHAGAVVLAMQKIKGINPNTNGNNLNPLPTIELVVYHDKLKYNIFEERTEIVEEKPRIKRRLVGEEGLEQLLFELGKVWDVERMFGPRTKLNSLRPMYDLQA